MSLSTANEFNLTGTPSEELKRRLMYLTLTGSGAVHTGMEGQRERIAAREKDALADDMLAALVQQVSEQEVRRLRERLALLDEVSLAALLENEKRMREAEEELRRIRERAFVHARPDGSKVRVYSDGSAVRDEQGNLIEGLSPSQLPKTTPELSEIRKAAEALTRIRAERKAIDSYRERLGQAQDRIERGPISQQEFDEIEGELGVMPDPVRAQIAQREARQAARSDGPGQEQPDGERLHTAAQPVRDFGAAAPEAPAIAEDDFADLPAAEPIDSRRTATASLDASTPGIR